MRKPARSACAVLVAALTAMTTARTATPASAQAAPAAQADPETCIDPATPLRNLLLKHQDWPVVQGGRRADEAPSLLRAFLQSGTERDYHRALFAYENLERDRPSDLAIKVALAALYSTGPDLNFKGSNGYRHTALLNNTNADARAVRDIEWLLERDSTQWLTAIALTRIALASPPDEDRTGRALQAVRRALTADTSRQALHLAWRDLLVRQERYPEAYDHMSLHPSSCTSYNHGMAELMMILGDTAAGSRLYLETLRKAAPEELDRFYDDIRVMATIGQLKNYAATSGAAQPAWLLSFWDRTSAASGRAVETRVIEQTVRAAYADAHFSIGRFQSNLFDQDRRLAVISDTSHIVPWSAGGVIFVRHGPPDIRRYAYEGQYEYEGWAYRSAQPPVVVILKRKVVNTTGWEAQYYPDCDTLDGAFLGYFDEKAARRHIDEKATLRLRELYFLLADVDDRYAEMQRLCTISAAWTKPYYPLVKLQGEFLLENRRLLPKLVASESSLPHFTGRVRIAIAAYQFRAADGAPQVVAFSWIPMIDLAEGATPAQRLRVTYSVADSLTGAMRKDTTVALPRSTTGVVRVPTIWTTPAITDGTLRVTAVDPADSTRGATRSMPLHVRSAESGLGLSDIVIADPGIAGPLVRGDSRLSPLPDHRVRTNDAFRLFFEVYGAPAGEAVETTIQIKRSDPKTAAQQLGIGKRDERTITTREVPRRDSRGVGIHDVEIAGDLERGNYSIDVTVRLLNGTTATRTAVLRVE